ncbi:MAG TPA: hypothetical protein VK557_15830, partial [Pyrinomonadaceae bacterium]|nr:hypothetical protein [Pyrinomonadaceae bacterium]
MFPAVYEINLSGLFHLLYFGLLIPVLAIRQSRKFRDAQKPLPNRLRHFQTTAFTLVFFGAMSPLV